MKPLVIYHADCTDGYGAAFAAWMKLGDEAEYLPMSYNDRRVSAIHDSLCFPTEVFGRDIYTLDFSFDRTVMENLFLGAKRVVWLDHHKTAFEMAGLGYEKGMTSACHHLADHTRHHILLDDNKSGALLAWEYFHPGNEVPLLIQHIDDRDRWQFKLEGSKELHAALSSCKPWSFGQWKDLFERVKKPKWAQMFEAEGFAILRAQNQHVASMAKQARKCEIWKLTSGAEIEYQFQLPGLAVNASLHQSEVGHELANKSGTYGLVWYLDAEGKVRCSLRSNGDYDVSAIAKSFGGGGHRNAAGFDTDIGTLMGWLK